MTKDQSQLEMSTRLWRLQQKWVKQPKENLADTGMYGMHVNVLIPFIESELQARETKTIEKAIAELGYFQSSYINENFCNHCYDVALREAIQALKELLPKQ